MHCSSESSRLTSTTCPTPDHRATIAAKASSQLGRDPQEILFVSDVGTELVAARSAGYRVALSIRPGNTPQQVDATVPIVHTFDEIAT